MHDIIIKIEKKIAELEASKGAYPSTEVSKATIEVAISNLYIALVNALK